MSFSFIIPEKEEFLGVPDGIYTAQVNNMDIARTNFGNYPFVDWKILNPSDFEGKIVQSRFLIEHEKEYMRKKDINRLKKFCEEIGELKGGEECTTESVLYKIATIGIKNETDKNGRTWTNVISHVLVNPSKPKEADLSTLNKVLEEAGMGKMPEIPTTSSVPLNDEVPF